MSGKQPQHKVPDAGALLQQAIALRGAQQFAEALALCDAILQTSSTHFDALHLSAVLAGQMSDSHNALERINKAIAVNPHSAEAYCNRGSLLRGLGEWDAALASYTKAVSLLPDCIDAHFHRGNILLKFGQWSEAAASYSKVIALKPDHADAHQNLGNALAELKKLEAALASYNKVIALRPQSAEAYSNQGNVLVALGQLDAALASASHAATLKPDDAEICCTLGNVLKALKRWDAALTAYDRAIALKPDYADAYYNRANTLVLLREPDAALASFNHAIALKPTHAEAYCNRGNLLMELMEPEAALASHDKAIALRPDLADAHYNKSLIQLVTGELGKGFEEYEWRWKADQFTSPRRNFPQPLWLGKEPLTGKTILLHWEQGFGDAIQFARYANLVADLGARVILLMHKPLARLLGGISGVAEVITDENALPAFDYHCPLQSLPHALGTTLDSIPSGKYLTAAPARVEEFRAKLVSSTKLRIGLVWQGRTTHANDHNRSIALADLIKHLQEGFQYISLQKDVSDADKRILASHPDILHFADELHDFTDTAALCEVMDVVLTIDTSVAHLSGALGKPTWILLPFVPDWRWLLGRDDSPWYPSVRLFRQPKAGDWESVFAKVKKELEASLL